MDRSIVEWVSVQRREGKPTQRARRNGRTWTRHVCSRLTVKVLLINDRLGSSCRSKGREGRNRTAVGHGGNTRTTTTTTTKQRQRARWRPRPRPGWGWGWGWEWNRGLSKRARVLLLANIKTVRIRCRFCSRCPLRYLIKLSMCLADAGSAGCSTSSYFSMHNYSVGEHLYRDERDSHSDSLAKTWSINSSSFLPSCLLQLCTCAALFSSLGLLSSKVLTIKLSTLPLGLNSLNQSHSLRPGRSVN